MSLNLVPPEVLERILRYVPPYSLSALVCTSSLMKEYLYQVEYLQRLYSCWMGCSINITREILPSIRIPDLVNDYWSIMPEPFRQPTEDHEDICIRALAAGCEQSVCIRYYNDAIAQSKLPQLEFFIRVLLLTHKLQYNTLKDLVLHMNSNEYAAYSYHLRGFNACLRAGVSKSQTAFDTRILETLMKFEHVTPADFMRVFLLYRKHYIKSMTHAARCASFNNLDNIAEYVFLTYPKHELEKAGLPAFPRDLSECQLYNIGPNIHRWTRTTIMQYHDYTEKDTVASHVCRYRPDLVLTLDRKEIEEILHYVTNSHLLHPVLRRLYQRL